MTFITNEEIIHLLKERKKNHLSKPGRIADSYYAEEDANILTIINEMLENDAPLTVTQPESMKSKEERRSIMIDRDELRKAIQEKVFEFDFKQMSTDDPVEKATYKGAIKALYAINDIFIELGVATTVKDKTK